MKRCWNKIIEFFDYFFYKATKTQVFDKDLEVILFGARCILSLLLYFLMGIIVWPILGLFADVLTDNTIDIIIIVWLILLLFITRFRYSDVTFYNRLKKQYQNEKRPALRNVMLLLLAAIIITAGILAMKYGFIVPHKNHITLIQYLKCH